jgi:hypothetical protein
MSEVINAILNGAGPGTGTMLSAIAEDVEDGSNAVQKAKELYPIGTRVKFLSDTRRVGVVIGYNKNFVGFYPASRYPIIIKWDGEEELFEYNDSSFEVLPAHNPFGLEKGDIIELKDGTFVTFNCFTPTEDSEFTLVVAPETGPMIRLITNEDIVQAA